MNTSPRISISARRVAVQLLRDGVHGAQIGGDVLALRAVAARRAVHEAAVLVGQVDRQPVDLRLGRRTPAARRLRGRETAARGRRTRRTPPASKALSSDSIGTRWRSLAKPPSGAPPTRSRANRPDQLRKARLDRGVAPPQRVVFGVGDLGRVVLVIGAIVRGRSRAARRRAPPPLPPRSASPRRARILRAGRCGLRAPAGAPSRSSAAARAASVIGFTRQHPGDLLAPRPGIERIDERRRPGRARHAFATRRCAAPRAATCGLCVTTSTCTRSATRASRSPTAAAVAPPMPESTSSNTRVGTAEPPDSTTFSASISRDSSPPEAMRPSGPGAWPGLVAIRNRTASAPPGPQRLGQRRQPRHGSAPCRAAAAAVPAATARSSFAAAALPRVGQGRRRRSDRRARASAAAASSAAISALPVSSAASRVAKRCRAAPAVPRPRRRACAPRRAARTAAPRPAPAGAGRRRPRRPSRVEQRFGLGQRLLRALQRGEGGRRPDSSASRLRRRAQPLQRPAGSAQGCGRTRAAPIARGEFGERGGDRFRPPLALLQPLPFGGQALLLALLRARALRAHAPRGAATPRRAPPRRSPRAPHASDGRASRQARHAACGALRTQRPGNAERVQQAAWLAGSASPICSCWPWTSTSSAPSPAQQRRRRPAGR